MATFVLVDGAWAGGWIWRDVARPLGSAGHEVFAPTLTGLGERVHLASPEVDLHRHVLDVVNVIRYDRLERDVLVGHGYGGMAVTGVAEREPRRCWGMARIGYAAGVLHRNTTVPDSVGSTRPGSDGVSYLRELPIRYPVLPRDR